MGLIVLKATSCARVSEKGEGVGVYIKNTGRGGLHRSPCPSSKAITLASSFLFFPFSHTLSFARAQVVE